MTPSRERDGKIPPPHRDQEERDNAHIAALVDMFVAARDRDFCEAFAHRLLSAVKAAR